MEYTKNNDNKNDSNAWRILGVMIFLGVAMVIGFAAGSTVKIAQFLSALSTGLLIGGAFFAAGGLAGFLFGIPKMLQGAGTADTHNGGSKTKIVQNDNLVEISDWLTKIIVGVGLTQLYNIPHFIFRTGEKLQGSFGDTDVGRNAAIAIILYFLVIGFLAVYIWTRLYFVRLLKTLRDELDPLNDIKKEINENKEAQERGLKLAVLSSKIDQFEKLKALMTNTENNFEGLKDILRNFQPGPLRIIDDSQKGRWGGRAAVNDYALTATVQPSIETSPEQKNMFSVSLKVEKKDRPLQGKVFFMLHESYMPNNIVPVMAEEGVAELHIESYEAFTVGAVCEDGPTLLELDLNEDNNVPKEYKYSEQLTAVDNLKEEKAVLLSEEQV